MKKEVKIIGLNIKQDFGYLKATELKLDPDQGVFYIKGEVGAGKSTLQKAMRITTQGSKVLEDKQLYGDNVDIEAQLTDGPTSIFISCRSIGGKLEYVLYTKDENGKIVKNPIIDGKRATPAAYLESLQTQLTWRLDELTSENPTTQRAILLELYSNELERIGVVFNKNSSNYVGGVIDQIEKAKNKRSHLDMKRKEVGGIAGDLTAKGIDHDNRIELKDLEPKREKLKVLENELYHLENGSKDTKNLELTKLKLEGSDLSSKIKDANNFIIKENTRINKVNSEIDVKIDNVCKEINSLIGDKEIAERIINDIRENKRIEKGIKLEVSFSEKGSPTNKPEDFDENKELFDLLTSFHDVGKRYRALNNKEDKPIPVEKEKAAIVTLKTELSNDAIFNQNAKSVNALHDWQDANNEVTNLNTKYYNELTQIETGVTGLKIVPGGKDNPNELFLMYDGSYDPEYFSNPEKELRKLSSYSDTQKPVICLLIQNYLLSKRSKVLPYLWIDKVPIDNKTKQLLDRMSDELGLKLFVSHTGDFDKETLSEGEILVENGEVFFNELG